MEMDSLNNKNWLVKAWNSGFLPLGLLRAFFGAGMIALAMIAYQHFGNAEQGGSTTSGYTAFLTIIFIGIVVMLFDTLLKNKQITTISAVYFGLLMGLFTRKYFLNHYGSIPI
jgi:hypothetical protein